MSERPVGPPTEHDPLSDFIDQLRVSASVHGVFELAAPFALQLDPRLEIDMSLLSIVRGSAAVSAPGVQTTLSAGDLLLRAGSSALLVKDSATSRAKVQRVANCPQLAARGREVGGDGAQTRFVGVGFRISSLWRDTLLLQLPPVLVTSGDDSPTLASAANLFRAEAASPQGASRALLGRLAEVIFIDILRRAGTRTEGRCGELRAFGDPPLARALALVHAEPAKDWTLESLGRVAGLSRSAFAARFLAKVGEPPLHFVARLRMRRAAQLLADSDAGLAEVALEVGYRSEASFSRAFARVMGGTPGRFRRQRRATRA